MLSMYLKFTNIISGAVDHIPCVSVFLLTIPLCVPLNTLKGSD